MVSDDVTDGALTVETLLVSSRMCWDLSPRERLLVGRLPALSVQILQIARERGRVTVSDVARVTGTSRNTVKDHMKALHAQGHLARHGAGRGVWYALALS